MTSIALIKAWMLKISKSGLPLDLYWHIITTRAPDGANKLHVTGMTLRGSSREYMVFHPFEGRREKYPCTRSEERIWHQQPCRMFTSNFASYFICYNPVHRIKYPSTRRRESGRSNHVTPSHPSSASPASAPLWCIHFKFCIIFHLLHPCLSHICTTFGWTWGLMYLLWYLREIFAKYQSQNVCALIAHKCTMHRWKSSFFDHVSHLRSFVKVKGSNYQK